MIHYLIELAIWMLIAYFIGCILGWFFKGIFAKPEVAKPVVSAPVAAAPVYTPPKPAPAPVVAAPAPAVVPPPAPRPAPVAAPAPVMAPTPVTAPTPVATGKMERPKGIAGPRGGKADNLQRISGIGPKNESILHTLGFFHFDQIAAWTAQQVTWVDDHLRFNGRISREEWIKQASLLAQGKEEEFTKQYGTGGMRNNKGQTFSGSRTRK
jgi:predicted flap endonuclease-1-like 5' DNA nuclease